MVVKINENYLKLKSSYLFVEVARREQEFVKNPDITVGKLVENTASSVGEATLKFVRFARFERGEGIEKKSENFADEVMKQVNG